MLSTFPILLSYQGFAPLLLRLTLAGIYIYWAYKNIKGAEKKNIGMGIVEGLIGISLFIGFLTQISALISIIILIARLFKKIQAKAFLTDGVNYYLILLIISISILISGAGFIAFDLPL